MKRLWTIGCMLACGVLYVSPVEAPRAGGKYWAMFCKSGPGIQVSVGPAASYGSVKSLKPELRIVWKKVQKKAGNNFENLNPGECSWPDRPLHDFESAVARMDDGFDKAHYYLRFELAPDGGVRARWRSLELCNMVNPRGLRFRIYLRAEKKNYPFEMEEAPSNQNHRATFRVEYLDQLGFCG